MIPLNNFKFVLLSSFPIFFITAGLLKIHQHKIVFHKIDLAWLAFVSLGGGSYFWATNPSQIWYYLFGWGSLGVWVIIIRSLSFDKSNFKLIHHFFLLLLGVFLLQLVFNLHLGIENGANWNMVFGKNQNYVASYLVILTPFYLYYPFKYKGINVLKVPLVLFVFYILYFTGARAAFLAFSTVVIVYLFQILPRLSEVKYYFFLCVFVFSIIFFFTFFQYQASTEYAASLINKARDPLRSHLIISSLKVFSESPIWGCGLGNWATEVYKYNLDDAGGLNHPYLFYRVKSHNFLSLILSELGIIGFLSFAYAFFPIKKLFIKGDKDFGNLIKACASAILVYLILTFFYASVNFAPYHFSEISLIVFCCLGLISNEKLGVNKKLRNIGTLVILIFSVLSSIWFFQAKYFFDRYQSVLALQKSDNITEAITYLEGIYSSNFRTMHDFNHSYALELAKLYEKTGRYDMADSYFARAYVDAPYNDKVLLEYSKYLLDVTDNPMKAKYFALKLHSVHGESNITNLLMAEISINLKEYEQANKYVESVKYFNLEAVTELKRLRKMMQ